MRTNIYIGMIVMVNVFFIVLTILQAFYVDNMFKVQFEIENDAFQNGFGREETARILEKITKQVLEGSNGNKILDINGNVVGSWKID